MTPTQGFYEVRFYANGKRPSARRKCGQNRVRTLSSSPGLPDRMSSKLRMAIPPEDRFDR